MVGRNKVPGRSIFLALQAEVKLKGVSLEVHSLAGCVCKTSLLKTKAVALVSGRHASAQCGRTGTWVVCTQPSCLPAAWWWWDKAAVQGLSALICKFSSLRAPLSNGIQVEPVRLKMNHLRFCLSCWHLVKGETFLPETAAVLILNPVWHLRMW